MMGFHHWCFFFAEQIRALLQCCLFLMLCWLADSSKHLKLNKQQQKTSSAPSNWLVTSCRTSGSRCSSGRLLRAASVQPRGSDTSRPTRAASGRPDKLWRCFSGWHEPTPCLSYLGRVKNKHSDHKHKQTNICGSVHCVKNCPTSSEVEAYSKSDLKMQTCF